MNTKAHNSWRWDRMAQTHPSFHSYSFCTQRFVYSSFFTSTWMTKRKYQCSWWMFTKQKTVKESLTHFLCWYLIAVHPNFFASKVLDCSRRNTHFVYLTKPIRVLHQPSYAHDTQCKLHMPTADRTVSFKLLKQIKRSYIYFCSCSNKRWIYKNGKTIKSYENYKLIWNFIHF